MRLPTLQRSTAARVAPTSAVVAPCIAKEVPSQVSIDFVRVRVAVVANKRQTRCGPKLVVAVVVAVGDVLVVVIVIVAVVVVVVVGGWWFQAQVNGAQCICRQGAASAPVHYARIYKVPRLQLNIT